MIAPLFALVLGCADCPADSIPSSTIREWLETQSPIVQIGWAVTTLDRWGVELYEMIPPDSAEYVFSCDGILLNTDSTSIWLIDGVTDTIRVYIRGGPGLTRTLEWGYFPGAPSDTLPPSLADTLWLDTYRGTLERLGEMGRWAQPDPTWPAYFWNPPPGFEVRYPVQIHHSDGTIEYPPTNAGQATYIRPPGMPARPIAATRAGEAWHTATDSIGGRR